MGLRAGMSGGDMGYGYSSGVSGPDKRDTPTVTPLDDHPRKFAALEAKIDEVMESIRVMKHETIAFQVPHSAPPNPDPFNFSIVRATEDDYGHTLVEVMYPDCTNYEGRKILLLEKTLNEINDLSSLDPHFMDDKSNGLIARFEPTDRGWFLGLQLLQFV